MIMMRMALSWPLLVLFFAVAGVTCSATDNNNDNDDNPYAGGFGINLAIHNETLAIVSFGAVHLYQRQRQKSNHDQNDHDDDHDTVSTTTQWSKVGILLCSTDPSDWSGPTKVWQTNPHESTLFVTNWRDHQVKVVDATTTTAAQKITPFWRQQQDPFHKPQILQDGGHFGMNVVATSSDQQHQESSPTLFVSTGGNVHAFCRDPKGQFQFSQELEIGQQEIPKDETIGYSLAASGNKVVAGGFSHLYLWTKTDDDSTTECKRGHSSSLRNLQEKQPATSPSPPSWKLTHALPTWSLNTMERSIDMDANLVAVGYSPPIYPFGQGGSVVIYKVKKNRLQKFQTLRGWTSDFFGLSVALQDGVLAVGAPEKVEIYEQHGKKKRFRHKQTLQDPSYRKKKSPMNLFGQNVAISNGTIVVGAYLKGASPGVGSGAAFVYTKDPTTGKWTLLQELSGRDPIVELQEDAQQEQSVVS